MLTLPDQEIKISSSIKNLSAVEKLIEDVCEQTDISGDHFGNILIAVSEAVNNAIQHGNLNNPEKPVRISVKASESYVLFTVRDEGKGFDFNNLPDPTLPENIENPNGRGIFLMKHLADLVSFNKGGSEVELKFYLR
ncbi:MAG: ATP-binding protein [Bacteroidota bacterium]|jgi:serine/threonine-protein kinase RsbW